MSWKRITLAGVLVLEVAILCLVAFLGNGGSADGLVVRPGAASIEAVAQTGPWGDLIVRRVVTPTPSWVVVQSKGGSLILGSVRVPAGITTNVKVTLDPKGGAINTLVVSIVADRGQVGVLEYAAESSGGGGGGMGGGAQPAQEGAASVSTADKPIVAAGKRIEVTLGETFRSGAPGTVHRVVQP